MPSSLRGKDPDDVISAMDKALEHMPDAHRLRAEIGNATNLETHLLIMIA
jgi:hypothetical protein